ncbi:MAG: asparagine synthase (glutamine-hydrolyzing) [Chitinophagaceae bacterium]|nr:asparagine synthase (glutamine-hydrolyzing) [Chitinophagaceae bacterium]
MCRIAGIINPALPIEGILELVNKMCLQQQHGGPDDEGFYSDAASHFVTGHRRLSIIDTSEKGHQPMLYAANRYVISYNGELYNYKELREELKKAGFVFTTCSDTEVILAAYQAWGTQAFKRFNGMYAFAIWDNQVKELIIARDPSGIKPLYYAATSEGFAFASEIKALKIVPWLQQPNNNWRIFLMAYGHLPEPVTPLQFVKPLPKGTYIKFRAGKEKTETGVFERFSQIEKISNAGEAVELIKETLSASVKKHLISDAPIGVFLSGGLDSSVIALLANQYQQQLNTVSLYFEDQDYSEKPFQDTLLKQLSCSHHQFLLKETDFHYNLPAIIKAMDVPCCDGINTWFISKYAKDSGLKAVLSGIGSDELLGGYPSFHRMRTSMLLSKMPDSFLRAGRFANSKILRRLCYLSIKGPVGRYLFLRGQFIPADIAAFLNTDEHSVWKILEEEPVLPQIDHLSPGNQASWLETNMYMQNQLLRDADVMSMAHGLEIRVPFLDKDFINLIFKIQSNIKFHGKLGKQLLIDAYKDSLPEMIWNRPKMGFSFPFKQWLGNDIYSNAPDGQNLTAYHEKLKADKMHWSQFFTLLLMHSYGNG